MTETVAGAASVGKMPDAEKPLDEHRPAVDNMSDKAESQQPPPYDANSSEKAEAAAEKKSEGSVRDYFVSTGRNQACCRGLMLSCSDSEYFDMRTASTVSCTRPHSQVLSRLVLLCR